MKTPFPVFFLCCLVFTTASCDKDATIMQHLGGQWELRSVSGATTREYPPDNGNWLVFDSTNRMLNRYVNYQWQSETAYTITRYSGCNAATSYEFLKYKNQPEYYGDALVLDGYQTLRLISFICGEGGAVVTSTYRRILR